MKIRLCLALSCVLSFVLRAEDVPPSAARLLPKETVILAELHDVGRTLDRLSQSSWGELARDPEAGEFFKKAVTAIAKEAPREVQEVFGLIRQAAPSGGFFAMTEFPDLKNPAVGAMPKMIGGLSYRGEAQVVDGLLQRFRDGALGSGKVKQSKETVEGAEIETLSDNSFAVSFVHTDKQLMFATDAKLLAEALTRRAGKGTPSLADSEAWATAQKEAVPSPDATGFFSYAAFFEKMVAGGGPESSLIAGMIDAIPQFLSVSTKLDGPIMRERAYLHYRQALPAMDSQHHSLGFTSEDTFAYLESNLASAGVNFEKLFEKNPLATELTAALQKHGLTLGDIVQTFGSEISFLSDWESGGLAMPTLFVGIEVRDVEKARKFATMISGFMQSEGKLIEKEHGGAKLWSVNGPVPLVQPTLALSGTHLMFGLNPVSVKGAIDRLASGKTALTQSEKFPGALKTVGGTNAGLAYLDSARLVERIYDRVRPFLAGAIAGNRKLSQYLDASTLPKTPALTKHMPPFVAAFQAREHGYVVESTGPLTYVAGVVSVAVVAGAAIPFVIGARMPVPRKAPAPPEAI